MGCGSCGGREGPADTDTPPQRTVHSPSQCSGPSPGAAAGQVALLRGPASASCSAKASHGPCLSGCWPEARASTHRGLGRAGWCWDGVLWAGEAVGCPCPHPFPCAAVIEEANWLTLEKDLEKPGDGFDAVICLGNSFAHLPDFKGELGAEERRGSTYACVHSVFQQAENVS